MENKWIKETAAKTEKDLSGTALDIEKGNIVLGRQGAAEVR